MQRLAIGDVAAVLIFFLDLATHVHVCRVLGELKNVGPKKTNTAFNGRLKGADGGHDRDHRENTDGDADHCERSAQFIRAQRGERHLHYFAKEHFISPQRSQRTRRIVTYKETVSGGPRTLPGMPCVSRRSLKLIKRPTLTPVNFR